jgi:hypothetical protein
MRAEGEWRPGRAGAVVGGLYRRGDEAVVGREVTDGIGSGRVACQLECLAAASAEIDLAAIAAPAWVGHPACSAEALEEG